MSAIGAQPHQPSATGAPGAQAWRPSPSFKQQQQLQQAAVPGAGVLSHQLSNGSTISAQPKDPRRARQLQQQLSQSSLGPTQQLPQQLPESTHGRASQQQVPQQLVGSGHGHQHMMGAQQGPITAGLQQMASVIPGMYIHPHAVLLRGQAGQGIISLNFLSKALESSSAAVLPSLRLRLPASQSPAIVLYVLSCCNRAAGELWSPAAAVSGSILHRCCLQVSVQNIVCLPEKVCFLPQHYQLQQQA